jgi:16S rRNA (guanine966-N2)-methyltransferase
VRVIAGSAKGRKLGPVPLGVRPMSDRAREGLFSSLAALVPGAHVLDLYAGTGAMGIEALSRGADAGVFVDRSTEACAAIYGNLALTGLQDRATVVAADARAFLTGNDRSSGPFDLVLLDPPYELEGPDLAVVLRELSSGWLAEDGWTVALTRGVKSSTPVIPVHWAVARQLRYGDSLVILYREVSWA